MIVAPETRTLKQIQLDYHRSLHPAPSHGIGTCLTRASAVIGRIGAAIARGIVYLLLALVMAFFLHFVLGPIVAGLSVPVLLLILILNS
jgi:hypothetical protein